MAGKSKWLREEGDEDWEDMYGNDKKFQDFSEDEVTNPGKLVSK